MNIHEGKGFKLKNGDHSHPDTLKITSIYSKYESYTSMELQMISYATLL